MTTSVRVPRRSFLKRSTAYSSLLLAPGLGFGRSVAPNDKLNIACVGCGGMGLHDVRSVSQDHNIVALCDVDETRAAEAFKAFPKAKKFKDYRRMLDELDAGIDAVTVTVPDHSHYPVAMRAMEAGKHVFVQKPMGHTVWEVRQMTLAARKHKVATQMGIQGHAGEGTRIIREWIEDGAIGKIREVHAWTNKPVWRQGAGRPADRHAVPKTLDWNQWLGTAPERPYHPWYLPFSWRGWWDFGSCVIGDMACHVLDHPFTALKLGAPTHVEAYTTPVNDETGPLASLIHFHFPARGALPPVRLSWYDGGIMPPWPSELEPERRRGNNEGVMFIGESGKLMCGCYGNQPRLIPEAAMKAYQRPEKTIPRSVGHYQEWLNACRGGPPAGANFDFAGPLTELVQLGNVAIRAAAAKHRNNGHDHRLEWDSHNLKITNDEDANRFLRYAHRAF